MDFDWRREEEILYVLRLHLGFLFGFRNIETDVLTLNIDSIRPMKIDFLEISHSLKKLYNDNFNLLIHFKNKNKYLYNYLIRIKQINSFKICFENIKLLLL